MLRRFDGSHEGSTISGHHRHHSHALKSRALHIQRRLVVAPYFAAFLAALCGGSLLLAPPAPLFAAAASAASSSSSSSGNPGAAGNAAARLRSLYMLPAVDATGQVRALSELRGTVSLVVNVASECGLTKRNYEELSLLHNRFAPRGFQVLAFPCNQFSNQEPKSNADILSFARTNHSAPFRIFAKTLVNAPLECTGTEAACAPSTTRCCPSNSLVFDLLKQHFPGDIEWNFAKFLVGKDGITIRRYAPTVNPLDIAPHIEAALAAPSPRPHIHSWWGFGDGKDEGHADLL
ncbi:hypothetical protein CLOM_g9027 [Closterium sp. NIES-68]|nr:hypothetical protein CLOM_g9027 [Closterium sp. NIES-68]GJP59289.1 hypothetical protein CLOP_g10185 [Closterium sp. NIES-67]